MSCKFTDLLRDYLDEKLSASEMLELERHLDDCRDCQLALDTLLNQSLSLNGLQEEVEDEIIISRIKTWGRGIRRITIFGFLGFVIGLFSRFYTRDAFIVTKAIMALPYKLAEFALSLFFAGNVIRQQDFVPFYQTGGTGFFPYNPVLDILAGLITPALISLFLALALGYLTSDRRVFQRKKIINFVAAGVLAFLLWVAVLYGVYSNTLGKIDRLDGIRGLTVYAVEERGSSWLISIDEQALTREKYSNLVEDISRAVQKGMEPYPASKAGLELIFDFSGGGRIAAFVDLETGAMILQNYKSYQLPERAVAQLILLAGVSGNE